MRSTGAWAAEREQAPRTVAFGFGWDEGGENPGDAHSPEPGPSVQPPPSDSVGGAEAAGV